MNFLKKFWQGWMNIAHAIGEFQARFILTVFYYTLLVPFAILARFFSDPLNLKQKSSNNQGWLKRSTKDVDLSRAHQQF